MKKISILILALGLVVSCQKDQQNNTPKKVEQVADAQQYILDKENSNIHWTGYKVLKSENTSHFGTMKFGEGEIGIKDNQVVSGKFTADVKSLICTDLAENKEAAGNLEGHLKSADFFDVEKFPTATFEITKVTNSEQGDYNAIIEGNLTIKGVTKAVSFNANIKANEQEVSIATEPTDIDRSLFGVNFQSPVENGVIKNEITLQISVKAQPKK